MKWLILGLMILLKVIPSQANESQEYTINTADHTCAIHYLGDKHKKLWTISVDNNYCQNGWVQGFTTVTLKDALNRNARTLSGFFHNGYWLSDFPGQIKEFFRYTPNNTRQDFIFKRHTDDTSQTSFYMVAQAKKVQGEYTFFDLCPEDAIILALHEPTTDFEHSIFQTNLIKNAQDLIQKACPQTTKFQIIGGTDRILSEEDGPFHATIDIQTEETTLSYTPPPSMDHKPQPTELRRESAEHLITIHPTAQNESSVAQNDSADLNPKTPDNMQAIVADSDQIQSAVDLALMAQVFQTPLTGKTVLYIENAGMSQTPTATHPLPLELQSSHPLNSGWYIVSGIFTPEKNTVRLHLLWEKQCQKKWCADEN